MSSVCAIDSNVSSHPSLSWARSNLQTSSIASITLRGDSKAPFEFRGTDITALSVRFSLCSATELPAPSIDIHWQISNEKILLGDRSGMLYITSTDMPDDSWIAHHHLGSQVSANTVCHLPLLIRLDFQHPYSQWDHVVCTSSLVYYS